MRKSYRYQIQKGELEVIASILPMSDIANIRIFFRKYFL